MDENGQIKVRCKHFKEGGYKCEKETCVFDLPKSGVYISTYYGCRQLTIDWTSYIKYINEVIVLKEDWMYD